MDGRRSPGTKGTLSESAGPTNGTPGDYRMWIEPDGEDEDGVWYGVWLTDVDAGETLWVGSLKFPLVDGAAPLKPQAYSTLEIYGHPAIRPIDISEWHVSLAPPQSGGVEAGAARLGYGGANQQNTSNSDVQYVDGLVHPADRRLHGTSGEATKAGSIWSWSRKRLPGTHKSLDPVSGLTRKKNRTRSHAVLTQDIS